MAFLKQYHCIKNDQSTSILDQELEEKSLGIEEGKDDLEFLEDKRYNTKKRQSMMVAKAYQELGNINKSIKVDNCGNFLAFKVYKTGDRVLDYANFCKARLCPMCQWRRSLLIFGQTRAVAHALKIQMPSIRFLMLTLTIPSVRGDELSKTIDRMRVSFNRLSKQKRFDSIVKGFFRALEVTYNKERQDYHPHLHIVLAVPPHYFAKYYIKHADWLQMWRDCYRDQTIQNVHITTIKPNPKRKGSTEIEAVAETCKYATKPSDYIGKKSVDIPVFSVLDRSLASRRLIGYGKEFKRLHAEMYPRKMEQASNEGLAQAEKITEWFGLSSMEEEFLIEVYRWHVGATHYQKEKTAVDQLSAK